VLAMFPPRAQEAVWGADPDALIAASFIFPAGRAHAVAGGYQLSGKWPLATGVDLCGWSLLGAIVEGEDENEPAEYRIFLVPKKDYRILDTWHASGLEATGSNDVEIKEVFVPADCTLAADHTKGGETPGSALNPGALYRIPVFSTFPYVRTGTALGIAEAAIAVFVDSSTNRTTTYTGVPLRDQQAVHIRLAEASALVDAARLMMIGNCAEAQKLAEQGRAPDLLSKVRYRRDGAFTVSLCARALDLLYEGSGGGAVHLRSRIQRAFKDIHAVRANTTFNTDSAGSSYGRVAFGQSADNPTL
jgi:3-hydroxy-9,10-secoandrosta-1,3,5(10)-triene-9,17-dione monooxygenase